jgi:hypothetical protein
MSLGGIRGIAGNVEQLVTILRIAGFPQVAIGIRRDDKKEQEQARHLIDLIP